MLAQVFAGRVGYPLFQKVDSTTRQTQIVVGSAPDLAGVFIVLTVNFPPTNDTDFGTESELPPVGMTMGFVFGTTTPVSWLQR